MMGDTMSDRCPNPHCGGWLTRIAQNGVVAERCPHCGYQRTYPAEPHYMPEPTPSVNERGGGIARLRQCQTVL